jgi:hypothetical protein
VKTLLGSSFKFERAENFVINLVSQVEDDGTAKVFVMETMLRYSDS